MGLFIINIVIALLWIELKSDLSFQTFCVGLILGFLLIWIFKGLFRNHTYIRRTLGFLRFVFKFLSAFLKANMAIASSILIKTNHEINPNIITYGVSDLSKSEILVLSHCITLTPGTTTIDISQDLKQIYIHAFDASDPALVRKQIENDLKLPILEFMR
jgi:multisubunit Na+/H+ antiporter MnhE subunit